MRLMDKFGVSEVDDVGEIDNGGGAAAAATTTTMMMMIMMM